MTNLPLNYHFIIVLGSQDGYAYLQEKKKPQELKVALVGLFTLSLCILNLGGAVIDIAVTNRTIDHVVCFQFLG